MRRRAERPAITDPLTVPEGDHHRFHGVAPTRQQAARRGHPRRGHRRPPGEQPRIVGVSFRPHTQRAQEAGEIFFAEPMIGQVHHRRRGRRRAHAGPARLVPGLHHAYAPATAAAAGRAAASAGGGSLARGSEGTSASTVAGCSSVAQTTPQRQHAGAPLAIGASQRPHTRAM